MSLYEKLMKMSVWKVVLLIAFSFFILITMIEELWVSRVFALMDRGAAYFEKIKAEDLADLEEDSKEFDKQFQASEEKYKKERAAEKEKARKDQIKDDCKTIHEAVVLDRSLENLKKDLNKEEWFLQSINKSWIEKFTEEKPYRDAKAKNARESLKNLNIDESHCDEYLHETAY